MILSFAGGAIQTSVNNMTPDTLGECALFEERQIGAERYVSLLSPPSLSLHYHLTFQFQLLQWLPQVHLVHDHHARRCRAGESHSQIFLT
jgi:hypothetical protein